jgi:RHS repeat-associated protein
VPRGIHAQETMSGWEWMVKDGLGSVRGVVDNSVGVLESRNYDPYGELFDATGSSQTSYGFTGEPTDDNNLVHLRARPYNPALGLFPTLDPFEGSDDVPMSLNGYSYVHGNPVNLTDPSGEIIPFIVAVAVGVPVLVGVIGAAWNLFVEQGRGVGGANQFADSKCIDWGRVAQAGGSAALGAVEAELGLIPPIGIAYGIGAIIKGIDPHSGWTPSEFNRTLLGYVGLTGAYDQLQTSPYYLAGRGGGAIASLAISAAALNAGINGTSITGSGSLFTSTGHTFGLMPVALSSGQILVGVTGVAGSLAIAQEALRNIVFSSGNPSRQPYELGPNDEDWRGTGKTLEEALNHAFNRTGVVRDQFQVTKWAKDVYGKSHPVEWRSSDGAEVSIDFAHQQYGPDVPHVGWQTAGKRGFGGGARGHILLDSVPYGR